MAVAQEHAQRLVAEQQVALYQHQYEEVLHSTSWRATAFLRWLKRQTDRSRRALKLVPVAIERGGGVVSTTRRVVSVLRHSGLSGMRRSASLLEQSSAQATELAAAPNASSVPANPPVHGPAPEAPPPEVEAQLDVNDYAEWVRRYDTLDDEQRERMRRHIERMAHRPVISVVMPTYNAQPAWLEAAIVSVRSQIYPHWELCIADDASTDERTRQVLLDQAALDPRIKVVLRPENGHIAAASNSALALASGEWVALMDHDDLLAESALFWIAEAIERLPDVRLIYSDEDKIDAEGQRSGPYFKSDWNIDLFYSQNMFSHLGAYRTDLLREVGGFQIGMEGSQDYDLVLRCIEHIEPGQIHHVPRVLYHWRVHAESTAQSTDAKPYAQLAGMRALNEHFRRKGITGTVEYIGHGYRARYELPDPQPLVSLIIPTRNAVDLLRQCINSILARTTYWNYEIIVVDNGSDDPETLSYLASFAGLPGFQVIRDDREFNYSELNNLAVSHARGELVGLINNDIEVISPDWLGEMVSIALQPGVGAVGARLWYPNRTLQHGGVLLGVGGVANHAHLFKPEGDLGYFARAGLIQSYSAVTAACLVVQRRHFLAVGGLNQVDLKVAFNDVDFCLRLLESGLRNVWTPFAELVHHESATRGADHSPEKRQRFVGEVEYMLARWARLLQCDPAYNPNLSLQHQNFELAWPPRIGGLPAPGIEGEPDGDPAA
ncbi:MAG: glycosyltransferase family 2 protein [Comamonadaceae bacterium]|nr:MAG: glycosyltransferase family 2 protein [Comamonadaceae bacterium]